MRMFVKVYKMWLGLILILTAFPCTQQSAANVSTDSFNSLQKLIYSSGNLYAAGTNTLYKLNATSLVKSMSAPLIGTDSSNCQSTGCSSLVTTFGTHNSTHLFLCTTLNGQCALVGATSLMATVISERNIVTDNSIDGTVVHVTAPFLHDILGPQNSIWITSSYYHQGDVKGIALAMRDPSTLTPSFVKGSTLSDQSTYSSILRYTADSHSTVQYVYAFHQDGFRFYVKNSNGRSYVGGMCSNDTKFNTLTELPLQCTSDGGAQLRYVQAAFMARAGEALHHTLQRSYSDNMASSDIYLFGVFADSATSTATSVCAFGVKGLIAQLNTVFKMCHINGDNVDVQVGPPELTTSLLECVAIPSLNNSLSSCDMIKLPSWTRTVGYSPLIYQNDEARPSIIDLSYKVNAFHIEVIAKFTVAFMNSPPGYIKRVVLGESNTWRGEYKSDDLSNLMTRGTMLLPSIAVGSNRIYVLTDDKVLSVPVQQCHASSTCQMCADLTDPHCGWCSLSSSCTTMDQCPNSGSQGHWLQQKSGHSGCITAELDDNGSTTISLDGSSELDKLRVALNEVPLKDENERYRCCYFGESNELCFDGSKKVRTDGLTKEKIDYLECPTPLKSTILSRIADGKDHIVTDLTLKVEEGQFAGIELTFYSCSLHESCTTCADTNADFFCDWCLETYTCFNSDTSTCSGAVIRNVLDQTTSLSGSSSCPRISATSSPIILVPSYTVPTNIIVNLHNRQDYMSNFVCVMSWDGESRNYQARVVGSAPLQMLQCQVQENLTYSGPEATKKVTLRVAVSEDIYIDNPSDVHVEMYKCDKMKQTCTECLSVVETKYSCGWCQSASSVCQVRELCHIADSGRFLDINGSSCPELEIIQIMPINGPVQGGTPLTLKGVNLGKSYTEIRDGVKILVDGAPAVDCVVDETSPHDPFKVICKTSEANEGSGKVRVTLSGDAGLYAQSATSFSFYDVIVSSLSTNRGPVSGGTKVAVNGRHINIGAHRRILMALHNDTEIECEIIKEDDLHRLVFLTPAMTRAQFVNIRLKVDQVYYPKIEYTFADDSTVTGIVPSKGILSGGTLVTVSGTDLDLIQAPIMYLQLIIPSPRRRRFSRSLPSPPRFDFECGNVTQTQMTCLLPTLPDHWASSGNISYGFVLDGIQSTLNLNEKPDFPPFVVVPDPIFDQFGDVQHTPGTIIEITGRNILKIGDDDIVGPLVKVELTPEGDGSKASVLPCNISAIKDTGVFCELPEMESSKRYVVVIKYGSVVNLELGTVMKTPTNGLTQTHYIIIGVSGSVFLIIIAIIIIGLKRRVSQTDEGIKKLQDKMNHLEMTVAKECKEAFTELQTDMTEMTADIAALHGLPFYEYKQYCMKVLFPITNESDHPVMRPLNIQVGRDNVEQGLRRFQELMYNKTFLLTFIRTLEQQKKFTVRERVELASYVSVALQPKMEYHTDILKTLLADLIERTMDSKKDPKILLRRNESVAEKMLSNWFAFLLQKFLKECAGEPLYLLYRAIKQHIDKGPVDAVTADAKYSLSEDKLLRQSVESQPLNLRFCSPDQNAAHDPQTVKVLDCDTISQAIDKILDTLYRNVPNSTKPPKDNLVLEWVKEDGERIPMSDEDAQFSKVESDGCKRLVTLQCYKITDNAMVALTPRQQLLSRLPNYDTSSSTGNYYGSTGDSMSRANSLNNILDTSGARERQRVHKYHLVKSSEADTHQEGDKMISEIYLNRLLFTKGTLQQFVDDLFETIFSTSHRGSALPLAIKYMFDFLDDQALLHNISNPEVIHHWKSNSLPLRFWVNVIKNPDFVFDIHKSNIVDACLTVVAQIFMDSCSLTEHRLGKDSPSSKLLYAKDIPKYRTWVDRYYSDIKSMPAISDQDMNGILLEESRQHRSEFNANAALYELCQYVTTYRGELMTALREDEFAKKDRLADQLDYVNQLLNIN